MKDIFSPDDEIVITRAGDKYIIEKATPERILKKIAEKLKELGESDKIKMALVTKKESRKYF